MTTELQAAAAEIEHKNEPSATSSDEVDTHINSLYNDALSSRDGYGNAHDDAKAIRAHIASLEAENKRLRSAFQWNPIDTAPKDCWIFIADKYFGVWQCRYNKYENIWIRVDDVPIHYPKLWMPLPKIQIHTDGKAGE